MTEERKKYLDSISKEERAIRQAIKYQQDVMSNCKDDLNNPWAYSAPANILKLQIADTKAIIKNLKKQLPAPRHEQYDYISDSSWLDCSCGKGVYPTQPYCMWCGQKLR